MTILSQCFCHYPYLYTKKLRHREARLWLKVTELERGRTELDFLSTCGGLRKSSVSLHLHKMNPTNLNKSPRAFRWFSIIMMYIYLNKTRKSSLKISEATLNVRHLRYMMKLFFHCLKLWQLKIIENYEHIESVYYLCPLFCWLPNRNI